MTSWKKILTATAFITLASSPLAQAQSLGEREFLNSCAQCHGVSGTGDGVMRGYLNSAVSDLTVLQKNNGGVFPVASIYSIVDGSAAAGAHGSSDMPAWGQYYRFDAQDQLGQEYLPENREAFVRGRILALIEYISTLQTE